MHLNAKIYNLFQSGGLYFARRINYSELIAALPHKKPPLNLFTKFSGTELIATSAPVNSAHFNTFLQSVSSCEPIFGPNFPRWIASCGPVHRSRTSLPVGDYQRQSFHEFQLQPAASFGFVRFVKLIDFMRSFEIPRFILLKFSCYAITHTPNRMEFEF